MKFEIPLTPGTMIKRYKRFLSDIRLENGEIVCAHVPNTGSMSTCWEEGWKVMLSKSTNPDRKLPYTLEMTHNGQTWIGVNTGNPMKMAVEALENKIISELVQYPTIKKEVKIGDSRIDLLLSHGEEQCYVEIKNVTLLGDHKQALFPDAVSERGTKHLKELMNLKKQGIEAAMLYIIQREDIESFAPAAKIDPMYAEHLRMAKEHGVQILTYICSLSPEEIKITKKVPFDLALK
ncbi:MAG: DNA/RNA nuclease SfsA [Bacteriovoracaceae bacterium]